MSASVAIAVLCGLYTGFVVTFLLMEYRRVMRWAQRVVEEEEARRMRAWPTMTYADQHPPWTDLPDTSGDL